VKNLPSHTFSQFILKFPEASLPLTLTEESIHAMQSNDSLTAEMIEQFIGAQEVSDHDALTEYIACFRIPETPDFHAVVLWKAALMTYEYILATFNKKGELISHATIAGLKSDGESVIRSVATIDSDWIIQIVEGDQKLGDPDYDAQSSKAYHMEILATGEIIFLLDEDELI
jgi:hypothetical protein